MSHKISCHVSILALVVILLPVSANADRAVPGKDDRPDSISSASYRRTTFPCDDPRQDLVLGVDEQLTFSDSTSGSSVIDGYACQPGWLENSPEHLYILRPSLDMNLAAWMVDDDSLFDLILLSDCDTDSCITQARAQIGAELVGGRTYYLVIDSFSGNIGQYDLVLETRPTGIPQLICEGGAEFLGDFYEGGAYGTWPGNLHAQPNLVSVGDCSDHAMLGGEQWFKLNLAPFVTLSLTIDVASPGSLDIGVWVFDGCGPDAICVAFQNDGAGGYDELLGYADPNLEPVTLYFAVDCARPPATEQAGVYSMHFSGVVPVSETSLSDVRALFR